MPRLFKSIGRNWFALFAIVVAGTFINLIYIMEASLAADVDTKIIATIVQEPQVLFDYNNDHCARDDTPDTQTRAFRDSTGQIHLFAVGDESFASIGATLGTVKRNCRIVLNGEKLKSYESFSNYRYVASTYTEDGIHIFALIHNEFHGNDRPDLCPSRSYSHCWWNSITLATSDDSGASFLQEPTPADNVVAALPYPYQGEVGHVAGYLNPSNIIHENGYFYVFFGAAGFRQQKDGLCVMRTSRLNDPKSWRAWDGTSFSIVFARPTQLPKDAGEHVCEPIGPKSMRHLQAVSIVRHKSDGLFIMIGLMESGEGNAKAIRPYISTSRDLINWSNVAHLFDEEDENKIGSAYYYTLIDPDTTDRNFLSIGDEPFLAYVKILSQNNNVDRQYFVVRVKITPKD